VQKDFLYFKNRFIHHVGCLLILTIALSQDHEGWSFNQSIYEVNTRQFTHSGTFSEFETHLDRLQDLGVGILYFMPIHPIGIQNRLGSLGSPYSVRDYLDVNPEFGTLEEFVALVDSIHARGMYVIMDWVANHTAWDNPLTVSHPEWYVTDGQGNFIPPPGTGWSDVIQLNYGEQGLRDYMIQTMAYWITEVDIDGFRIDAVSFVPDNFWPGAIAQLKAIKPEILMLAEDDGTQYQNLGFDMTYAWGLYGFGNGVLQRMADGDDDAINLANYLNNELNYYSDQHYRMYFTSNHDENSWYGTVFERFGAAAEAFAVLTVTMNSMPLIYSGQEAGLDHSLAFFDKDEIVWQAHPFENMYSTLFHLKKENRALWNGSNGGLLQRITTTNNSRIFSFVRESEDDKVFAVFNLSASFTGATLIDTLFHGTYADVFSGDTTTFDETTTVTMPAWSYHIYEQITPDLSVDETPVQPIDFHLWQNYPNPFNPVTTIQYDIPFASHVKIAVFDITGRWVTTLVDERQISGENSVTWNGKDQSGENVSSGVYICRMDAGNSSTTRQMVLLR